MYIKIPRLGASEFLHLSRYYPLVLLALLLLPPLLLVLLLLDVGEEIFFNRSYQKDDPCETAAAVRASPKIFKPTNRAQSIVVAPAAGRSVCHQPI